MKIRKEKSRGGYIYRLDAGYIRGERQRFSFPTKKEAEAKRADLTAKQKAVGDQWATLKAADKVRLSQIHGEIVSAGFALSYVWDEFRRLRGRDTGQPNVTVSDAVAQMLEAKERAGRAVKTLRQLRDELGHFVTHVNGKVRDVASITVSQVEAYCAVPNRRTGAAATRTTIVNRSRRISALFSYAERMGWCDHNPVKRMERIKEERHLPYIIPNDHVERLMLAALDAPDTLPQIVLCLFAGLRAGEASQMNWSDIDLDRGLLTVRPEISKLRDSRVVYLQPTARAWMALAYERRTTKGDRITPFHEATVSHKVLDVRTEAGLKPEEWAHAAMRHTAATHLYHVVDSMDELARNMGHSLHIFFKHYRGLINAEKSAEFWQITPDTILKVADAAEVAA